MIPSFLSGKSAIWAIKEKQLQIRLEKLYLLRQISNLVSLTISIPAKGTFFLFLLIQQGFVPGLSLFLGLCGIAVFLLAGLCE